MKHELSDMLAAQKENPPPPRYTADDVLAAGRKRQSRRRVLLTGAGSAAAVVAVAAAIAVPQIVTHSSPGRTTAPANQAAPVAAAPATKVLGYPSDPFTGDIAPFTFGDLKVSKTIQVTTSYEVATIVAPGKGTPIQDEQGTIHQTTNDVGTLVVYREGVYSTTEVKSGHKITVNGKPGFYVAPVKQVSAKPGMPTSYSPATLAWSYADDSWAVVTASTRAKLSEQDLVEQDLVELAGKVASGPAEELKVDFKLGYLPAGFALEGAGPSDSSMLTPMDGQSFLRVVKGGTDYKGLTGPILDAPVVGDKQFSTLSLAVYPIWYSKHPGSKSGSCAEGLCYKTTADGKYVVELNGGGFLPDSELLKVVRGVTFADPTDPSSWFKATAAVS